MQDRSTLTRWLALLHSPGVGPIKFRRYLQDDPQLNYVPSHLNPNWDHVHRDLAWLERTQHASIICCNDANYPQSLLQIYDPPPLLYTLGDTTLLAKPQLAIVGGRRPTRVGRDIASSFAKDLYQHGLIITSGMATGIDAAAHAGAMLQGKTIAVVAHGLDTIYPASHRELAAKIISNGCIVSEFPIGTRPLAPRFVRRNRIISGLSLGVLVIDAAAKSGALLTAAFARDQNREVFTVPGDIYNQKVKGCHRLLKEGAKLVESVDDVLEELANLFNYEIRDTTALQAPKQLDLSVRQALVLKEVRSEAVDIDAVAVETGLTAQDVGSILVELELNGLIKAVSGGYARRQS